MCLSCQLHANPVSAVIWKPFPEILLKMHLGIHIHIHLRVDEQNLPKVIGGKKSIRFSYHMSSFLSGYCSHCKEKEETVSSL